MCDGHITFYFVKKLQSVNMARLSFPRKSVTTDSGMTWYLNLKKDRLKYQKIAGKPYDFQYIMVR